MSTIIRGFVLIAVVLAVAGLIAYRVRSDSDEADAGRTGHRSIDSI